jgi:glutamine amidotransferase
MIAVIDYGMGNLGSITKALAYVGGDVVLTSDPNILRSAERIVLPGVGAFGDGMSHLRDNNLVPVLVEEVLEKKKPFMGVCLGMQLLAKVSYEFGEHVGLGWIDASVRKFESTIEKPLLIPHVGWDSVSFKSNHPLFSGVPDNSDFYFVHSYFFETTKNDFVAGVCDYGQEFAAVVAKENIFATQFHPEKSQKWGLRILKNFISWKP